MYRKINNLLSQVENGKIDVDRAQAFLESILEQAEAADNYDARKIAGMALERLPGVREKRKMAFSALVELLCYAFAEKDIETLERHLLKKHSEDGYEYDYNANYRDSGIVSEHFTAKGNVFVWFKDFIVNEEDEDDRSLVINEVAFLFGKEKKVKVIDFQNIAGGDTQDQLKVIMDELNNRGL